MNNSSIRISKSIPDLPDNVHKHIAQFLKGKERNCSITLILNAGCPEGYHSFEEIGDCMNCIGVYSQTKTYILLKKGGDRKLFKKYIDTIKNKLTNNNLQLKGNYSQWSSIGTKGPPWKMEDLIDPMTTSPEQRFIGPVALLPWEIGIYEIKYVFYGLYFALFYALIEELHPIPNFYTSGKISVKNTIRSSSPYFEIIGKKKIKHPLSAVNKLYNKYTLSK